MTEQEQKAIKWMKNVRDDAIVTLDHIAKNESNVSPMLYAGRKEKAETIINGFEELEQYRTIGAVKEIIHANSVGLAERVQLEKYQSIGTVEECRAAVEKIRKIYEVVNEWDKVGYSYSNNHICEIKMIVKGGGVDA